MLDDFFAATASNSRPKCVLLNEALNSYSAGNVNEPKTSN